MEQLGGTDAELWDRCIQGEAEALDGLFDRYADAVFRYCLSRTGSWQDAEDLVSITFLEAWRQRSRLVLERDSLLPWLLGVATNSARNRARSVRRHEQFLRRLPHAAVEADPASAIAARADEGIDYDAAARQGDPQAGKQQIADPVGLCAFNWDQGLMNPGGITDDLIPPGYKEPAPAPAPTGTVTDAQGNPATAFPNTFGPGHFVPELRACVVDNTVAVIPGPADVCSRLGIPVLES